MEPDQREHQVQQDQWEIGEPPDPLVTQDSRVLMVLRVHQETEERPEIPELTVLKDLLDQLDLEVLMDPWDHLVCQVLLDQ